MRLIKFRAWNKNDSRSNERMIYGVTLHHDGQVIMPDGCLYNYPLMQYTGIKDSEGVEIYEGDIVQWLDRDYAHNELIEYDVEKCAFTLGGTYINTKVELSVIGNIYENPELLK
jgi:uncharacterized phage protein (TIGR01671 family)